MCVYVYVCVLRLYQGTGRGGKSAWGVPFADEFDSLLKHQRGTLSMANSGSDSNQSQFFISYKAHPHLNNVNTVFGRFAVTNKTHTATLFALVLLY
jgi:cyclophilin family peptidyl-prolyl cis-trans isomerase